MNNDMWWTPAKIYFLIGSSYHCIVIKVQSWVACRFKLFQLSLALPLIAKSIEKVYSTSYTLMLLFLHFSPFIKCLVLLRSWSQMQFHLFHKLYVITQLWALYNRLVLAQSNHKQGMICGNLKVKFCRTSWNHPNVFTSNYNELIKQCSSWTTKESPRNRHSRHGGCHSSSDGYGGQRIL